MIVCVFPGGVLVVCPTGLAYGVVFFCSFVLAWLMYGLACVLLICLIAITLLANVAFEYLVMSMDARA